MISEVLKNLRITNNVTQSELATVLNVSRGAIAMWETGKRNPDNEMIVKIANFFEVSTDYLLGNPMTTEKSPSKSEEDIKVALFGGDKEVSEELWDEVMKYAEYLKEKYKKD